MFRSSSHLKRVKWSYLLLDALWLVSGLVLLVWPRFTTQVICAALGVLSVIYGVVKLFGYFSRDPYRLAFQFDLALGIFFLLMGASLLLFPSTLLSILPVLIGVLTVISGVFKLQTAFEARRFGMGKWWWLLVLSLGAISIGVVLLVRPFQSALLAVRLMGLAIVVDGVQDLTTTAYTVKTQGKGVVDVDDYREV